MTKKFLFVASVIFVGAFFRLLPHPPNFTPIAAMALFGGAYLDNKKLSFILPLSMMFLSDLILGFHVLMPVVYLAFIMTVFLGIQLRRNLNSKSVLLGAIASSVLFFVITNLGVWVMGTLYPRTFGGLIDCYVMAIPFFRNAILGDMIYAAVLFGGFKICEKVVFPPQTENLI